MTKTYEQPKIVTELTPELSDKLLKHIYKIRYDEKVSKEAVLRTLKQVKAEMGKLKKQSGYQNDNTQSAIAACMQIITNKIAKINGK